VVRIERQGHPRYYDVNRNRTLLSEISDPVYHPHVVAVKEELRSWRSYYVEPSLVRRDVGVHGADDPGRHGEELAAFYWKLKHESPDQFKAVNLNLRSLVPSLRDIDVREIVGTLDPVVIERDGGEFPFRLASEGTLRLLCLLAIAIAPNPPAVVAYEEPENGVQPARLDVLAQVIENLAQSARTQVLLTTHSPTFLDRIRGATFVACRRGSGGGSEFLGYEDSDKVFARDDFAESRLSRRMARGDF
jgi:predicted ATPase